MAEEIINNGTTPGDFTGEGLYYAFGKAKRMFTELYAFLTSATSTLLTHTSQIAALQGGQTSQAGQIGVIAGQQITQDNAIAAINAQMTDGTTIVRFRVVAGVFYVDRTLTVTGFAGTEDQDWENIGGNG